MNIPEFIKLSITNHIRSHLNFKETMAKKNYVLEEESAHVRMVNLGANVTRTGQEKIALAV